METVVCPNNQFYTGNIKKIRRRRKEERETNLADLPTPVLDLVSELFLQQGKTCRVIEFNPGRNKGSKWRRLSIGRRPR